MKSDKEVPIEKSIRILQENITKIDRVYEWAEACGFNNPKKFSRLFRNHFGERPSVVMKKMKVDKAIELLSNGEDLSNYEIALKIGKRDEKALNHFIRQQTGNPPENYKSKK
ncbi:helix-turn-helix domain-containing protein [Rhodohalobacter sulfatireducens]|uniref:AraC family transcriptional regulator n=1 Tax=Rhodohalobacter sulfatireducens TaxID=2911366 RepID=A0ABS9KBN2_9BACT|nr:AraC family transcriptional regulator [Rhodohalobacter sulfatireducens]MCG2588241.1 AraC family transcriptional regulator [Rhodohalobacter sulfatireducens]